MNTHTRRTRALVGAPVAVVTALAPAAGALSAQPPIVQQADGGAEADGAPPVSLGDGRDDASELVSWWQDRLNEWLLLSGSATYPIVVDGWYGPNTEAATVEFQEAVDVVDADGIVNPEDRVALHDAIEALGGDSVPGGGQDGDDGGADGDGPAGFGTGRSASDDFPATGDVNRLQDVSVTSTSLDDGSSADRLVLEFATDTGAISYEVAYVDSIAEPSGAELDLDGTAVLDVTVAPASGVDLSDGEQQPTYGGPDRFSPDSSAAISELALVEDFEGTLTWGVGVDEQRPFRVQVLETPLRLVVDVRGG